MDGLGTLGLEEQHGSELPPFIYCLPCASGGSLQKPPIKNLLQDTDSSKIKIRYWRRAPFTLPEDWDRWGQEQTPLAILTLLQGNTNKSLQHTPWVSGEPRVKSTPICHERDCEQSGTMWPSILPLPRSMEASVISFNLHSSDFGEAEQETRLSSSVWQIRMLCHTRLIWVMSSCKIIFSHT